MVMKKLFYLILIIIPLLTMGAACDIKIGKQVTPGGGVYKSANQGDTWQAKNAVPVVGDDLSITNVNVLTMVFDPQDHQAIYLGTLENGLFYTYTGGESWAQVSQLKQGRINSIAVDPIDKCNLYVTFGNKILKSTDCGRNWQDAYYDARAPQGLTITDLAIDNYNPQIIYAGASSGDLLKSLDGGKSWATIERFKNQVKKIVINYYDTRLIYVATKDNGIFKTIDSGRNWANLENGLKAFNGGKNIVTLVLDKTQKDVLVAATNYGLLKSTDGGSSWQAIELLTPPGGATIYSLALDPQNANNIYYGTATTFYKTVDGGKTWISKKLPSDKAPSALLVDFASPSVMYMGTMKLK